MEKVIANIYLNRDLIVNVQLYMLQKQLNSALHHMKSLQRTATPLRGSTARRKRRYTARAWRHAAADSAPS